MTKDISNNIDVYEKKIKEAIKEKDFKEYEKILEKELKRIELIKNEIDLKDKEKEKDCKDNTFGFNQKKYNGIFNLLASIIDIDYGKKIYDVGEKKELINNVELYYNSNKVDHVIPLDIVKQSVSRQIQFSEDEDTILDTYKSEKIYKINYFFLEYLLKKYNIITDKEVITNYENFLVLLDNRGFKRGKTIVEAASAAAAPDEKITAKIANKDIWMKTAYGLPSTINEPTDGKTVDKIFSKYIDKTPNIDGLPESIDVKKYMDDNFSEDRYYIFRELYEKWKDKKEEKEEEKKLKEFEKTITETKKYTKDGNKGYEIDKGILDKFEDKDLVKQIAKNINAYFKYYDEFSDIMAKIYYGYDMKQLRIEIQNLFINHKKNKRIKKLKEDLVKKLKEDLVKNNNILYRKSGGGEIYNAFNINTRESIDNYIDYINDDIEHDDKYILPVIMDLYKVTKFVIFEENNGSLKIRVPFDLFFGVGINNKFTLILKNTNEYSLLYYNRLKDIYDIAYNKGYGDGYKLRKFVKFVFDQHHNQEAAKEGYKDGYKDGKKEIKNEDGGQSGGTNRTFSCGFNTKAERWWDNIIKDNDYIIIYNNKVDTCSQKWLNEKIDKLYKDIEKIQNSYKDNIPTNIYTYDSKYIEKIQNKKYYINSNNKVTHVIDDKHHFFPIYPCGLNRIPDIGKDNIKFFENLKEIPINDDHIKKIEKNCSGIAGYIKDDNGDNVLFGNNTYIRIKANASNIPIIGYIDLFTLDNELGKRMGDEKIEDEEIIKEIDKYYKFKDELLKKILNDKSKEGYIKKPDDFDVLIEIKDPDNIDKIYKSLGDDKEPDKEHLYRFIDLLYKYRWPSYDNDNYLEYIYIEPSDLKDNIKEGELYFEYADYEDVDAQTDKERKENSILNKYYNKKNKYYKSLKLYNDNKSDDYDY